VMVPMREHTDLNPALRAQLADMKIQMAGLAPSAGDKYPSDLSGGMRKRAALARALSLDPELVFLDEPTAGLDPLSAGGFDTLVKNLKESLGLTIMMVTHDLDLLWQVADRVAILGENRVLGIGTMEQLSQAEHPVIREYFYGTRGRAARDQAWKQK
ncbi:MAG: ABC transporter ATP-binding protein, partial [Sulfurimicrobium sp.]